MFYPFCEICTDDGDIAVVQSPLTKDGHTVVHFEKPDSVYGFKTVEITVPDYIIGNRIGFTDDELSSLLQFTQNTAHLLLKYAQIPGGVNEA